MSLDSQRAGSCRWSGRNPEPCLPVQRPRGALSCASSPGSVSGRLPSEVAGSPQPGPWRRAAVLGRLGPARLRDACDPAGLPASVPGTCLVRLPSAGISRGPRASVNHVLFSLPGSVCCPDPWSPPSVCSHSERRRGLPQGALCFRCERAERSCRISLNQGSPPPGAKLHLCLQPHHLDATSDRQASGSHRSTRPGAGKVGGRSPDAHPSGDRAATPLPQRLLLRFTPCSFALRLLLEERSLAACDSGTLKHLEANEFSHVLY